MWFTAFYYFNFTTEALGLTSSVGCFFVLVNGGSNNFYIFSPKVGYTSVDFFAKLNPESFVISASL